MRGKRKGAQMTTVDGFPIFDVGERVRRQKNVYTGETGLMWEGTVTRYYSDENHDDLMTQAVLPSSSIGAARVSSLPESFSGAGNSPTPRKGTDDGLRDPG